MSLFLVRVRLHYMNYDMIFWYWSSRAKTNFVDTHTQSVYMTLVCQLYRS